VHANWSSQVSGGRSLLPLEVQAAANHLWSVSLTDGLILATRHRAILTDDARATSGTCTVDVVYNTAGRPLSTVMYGVPSGEIHGPPWRRLLNITYQSGYETDPTTNDMPDGIWIGFGAAGLAFAGWGSGYGDRKRRPRESSPWRLLVGHQRTLWSLPL
jgi:hypothetical protein